MAQFEVAVAQAIDHAAHTVALHHHRHRMVFLRDQGHFRHERLDARHLPHEPIGIEHRQAQAHAGIRPAIDDDAPAERIGRIVEHFDAEGAQLGTLAHAQQAPQFGIFRLETGQGGRAQPVLRLDAPQTRILGLHLGERGEIDRPVGGEFHRPVRRLLDRAKHHRDRIAHRSQRPEAQIEHQEQHRRERRQPQALPGGHRAMETRNVG